MARVEAFKVGGILMWFPSGDHGPAHFHARKAEHWVAKVYLQEGAEQMIELIRPPGAKMKRADRKAIVAGVEEHRLALLAEWERCQGDG